jgi:hypothetical protein
VKGLRDPTSRGKLKKGPKSTSVAAPGRVGYSPPPMSGGRPTKEERREQILQHARAVFAEKGYHHATVEDIVARV